MALDKMVPAHWVHKLVEKLVSLELGKAVRAKQNTLLTLAHRLGLAAGHQARRRRRLLIPLILRELLNRWPVDFALWMEDAEEPAENTAADENVAPDNPGRSVSAPVVSPPPPAKRRAARRWAHGTKADRARPTRTARRDMTRVDRKEAKEIEAVLLPRVLVLQLHDQGDVLGRLSLAVHMATQLVLLGCEKTNSVTYAAGCMHVGESTVYKYLLRLLNGDEVAILSLRGLHPKIRGHLEDEQFKVQKNRQLFSCSCRRRPKSFAERVSTNQHRRSGYPLAFFRVG
jgi:hypothetical protein